MGGIFLAIVMLIAFNIKPGVSYTEPKCQIEKMSYQTANSWCNSTGGKAQFEFLSKWRRNDYALVLTKNNTIADTETTVVNIKAELGEINTEVISPSIVVAKINKDQAEKITNNFEISGIFFEKVDINLVNDEFEKEWLNTWNSDEQHLVGCVCPEQETWSCGYGCKKISRPICIEGGGGWSEWKQKCQCSEGQVWYSNLGRCEDVAVE